MPHWKAQAPTLPRLDLQWNGGGGGLQPVNADFAALVRSLQNLITNAVKYGGESRWLRVSATAATDKGRTGELNWWLKTGESALAKTKSNMSLNPSIAVRQ